MSIMKRFRDETPEQRARRLAASAKGGRNKRGWRKSSHKDATDHLRRRVPIMSDNDQRETRHDDDGITSLVKHKHPAS
jgi:hypothetical protein